MKQVCDILQSIHIELGFIKNKIIDNSQFSAGYDLAKLEEIIDNHIKGISWGDGFFKNNESQLEINVRCIKLKELVMEIAISSGCFSCEAVREYLKKLKEICPELDYKEAIKGSQYRSMKIE